MLRLSEISEDTTLFPWKKVTPFPAVLSTVAVLVALAAGVLLGHPAAGSIAAGAAFTVGFAVFHEALSSTLLSMAVVTTGIASATLIGSLGAHWGALVLLMSLLAALNYGILTSIDPTASWIGQQCAVFVVINSYFPRGLHYAGGRTAMVLAGGGLQMMSYGLFGWWQHLRQPGGVLPDTGRVLHRVRELWVASLKSLGGRNDTTVYVAKLMVALGLSTALYRTFHWRNGYWAPMTAVLVLKPKWANTLSRGVARLAGTLVGVAMTVLLVQLTPAFRHEIYFALIVMAAYGCFALQAVNYALFSVVLTLYVVFLFGFGGFSERGAADLRLLNTAIGGGLALLVDWVTGRVAPWFLAPPKPEPAGAN